MILTRWKSISGSIEPPFDLCFILGLIVFQLIHSIELAGEINTNMPRLVISKLAEALSLHAKKSVNGARILILGMAYKKNVDDMRESPSLVLMELLEERGAQVEYHDPYVNVIPHTRAHSALAGRESTALTKNNLARYDVVLVSTDHDGVDYQIIGDNASLVVDTRNAFHGLSTSARIVKA